MTLAKRKRSLGKVVAILAVAALALVFAPFQASALPIVGQTIVASGGDVSVAFVSSDAAFQSFLFLVITGPIFDSDLTAPGTTVILGFFAAGTPLPFSIKVDEQANGSAFENEFFMGNGTGAPAGNPLNPDGIAHAGVDVGAATFFPPGNQARIGFEDIFGGGDLDYNDHVFDFQGVVLEIPKVPNPSALLLIGLGLVGMAGWSRVRTRK